MDLILDLELLVILQMLIGKQVFGQMVFLKVVYLKQVFGMMVYLKVLGDNLIFIN